MNILIVVDKKPSAISVLAESVKKYNPHFDIRVVAVHPKRASLDALVEAQELMRWADLINVEYWKSGKVLKTSFPGEFKLRPKILTHHNPYDLRKEDWKEYDAVVVKNKTQQAVLPMAYHIPHGIDLDFFKFNEDYNAVRVVNMTVARIEGKKGIREVAQICRKLKYKFILVGRVSSADYMGQIVKEGGDYLEFHENCSDEKLRECYYKSTIHICNSVDGFESGTMPILESMACGLPVLTRNIGHVPETNNGKNMVVRDGTLDDMKDLEKEIKMLVENKVQRMKIREYAFNTVRNYSARRMARRYSKLYYQVLGKEKPLVSIIIPTYNRGDALIKCIASAVKQTYSNKEIVVADSGETPAEAVILKFREQTKVPIKYIRFEKPGEYTLAEARNRGVVESEGEFLVFCDDRLEMDENAVQLFVQTVAPRTWLWGEKDGYKKGFVENFSCVARRDLIIGGMFNEQIDRYGGMTQEIKTRFQAQGVSFMPVNAQAKEIVSTKKKGERRQDIIDSKFKLFKMYD